MRFHSSAFIAAILLLGQPVAGFARDIVVGMSWPRFQAERWQTDEAAIRQALEDAGVGYISTNAVGSVPKQIADIESLAMQGVSAIIVLGLNPDALESIVNRVVNRGIPVIAYDRLIETPLAFYVSFDSREVGRMQARALLARKPTGRYAFIKGDPADPNTRFLFSGQLEVLADGLAFGEIVNAGEANAEGWSPDAARMETEKILAANNGRVDAVVASNDEIAEGAIAALSAYGLAGETLVSGQDAEASALNRVALGTQTVTVWKDSRTLGQKAGEIGAMLAKGGRIGEVDGAVRFAGGRRGIEVFSYFLPPVPITRDNLQAVSDAGWASRAAICAGVRRGQVAFCD